MQFSEALAVFFKPQRLKSKIFEIFSKCSCTIFSFLAHCSFKKPNGVLAWHLLLKIIFCLLNLNYWLEIRRSRNISLCNFLISPPILISRKKNHKCIIGNYNFTIFSQWRRRRLQTSSARVKRFNAICCCWCQCHGWCSW